MAKQKKDETQEDTTIVIEQLRKSRMTVWLIGDTPLIFNSMSAKARHELLYPYGQKTTADKAQSMKDDPMCEYRDSCYRRLGKKGPTRLVFPTTAFKSAICTAALEVTGVKKAQIGRLVWVEGHHVDVYGVPQMYMAVVRNADMKKTPDVRTRAIVENWACRLTINFIVPTLNETTICRLLETGGLVIGVGDFRQEKGKGNNGQYHICEPSDVEAIVTDGGLKHQDEALKNPQYYDLETEQLMTWFIQEKKTRGKK